jgi:hypothetical protein
MLWIGICHIILPLLMILFVVVAPIWVDKWMFLYVTMLGLHWVVLNGECLISYLYKVGKNASYTSGSTKELEDINDVLILLEQRYGLSYKVLHTLMGIINVLALLLVVVRFIILKSVKPVWASWVLIGSIYAYIATVRLNINTYAIDIVYILSLAFITSKVLLKT